MRADDHAAGHAFGDAMGESDGPMPVAGLGDIAEAVAHGDRPKVWAIPAPPS